MRCCLAVALACLLACSKAPSPGPSPVDAAATPPSASASAPRQVPFDRSLTKKAGDGVTVMFVEASGGTDPMPPWVILSFNITNDTDKERVISSVLSVEVSAGGLPVPASAVDRRKSRCDGHAPPHGDMGCLLMIGFPGDKEPPRELRVRVEGAWFRVEVERPDGGR